ncbi:MAG TPA: hypothetical protein VEH06_13725 [Candidatus Bathyarchaeia archaeon]|nr:hypothetical protein [Candidatus Bathyarchaeia archaeon]
MSSFTLFYPTYAITILGHPHTTTLLLLLFSLVTIASIFLCSVISLYFYRTYRFSGYRYLLGLPTGFVILAISFVFGYLNVVYSYSHVSQSLENIFLWMQLALRSEGFAFIALSYMLKNRMGSTSVNGLLPATSRILFSPQSYSHAIKIKEMIIAVLPMILISIPLMVTISALFVQPVLNDTELRDMSIYTTIFNIMVLGYIFIKSLKALVRSANIKLLYIPAAFALLWLEQYSLIINYFDNNQFAFMGSTIARLVALSLFVFAIYHCLSTVRRREMEIET